MPKGALEELGIWKEELEMPFKKCEIVCCYYLAA
jgi:hypothetical protein